MSALEALRPYLPFLPVVAAMLTLTGIIWAVIAWRRDNERLLTVRQVGSPVENTIISLNEFTTAIMLNAVIVNDSPKATIVVGHFDLKLPWNDPEFDWLDDPADYAPARSEYAYSGTLAYKRDMVLNHHRYGKGKLAPGDSMEGLLMGKSMKPIPVDFVHGSSVTMDLIVIDTKKNKYSAPVELRIDRRWG
jgi:hypothetical protein